MRIASRSRSKRVIFCSIRLTRFCRAASLSVRCRAGKDNTLTPFALSFFSTQEALDIAVESLLYDQDDYLEYTLKETMTTLEGRVGAGG